MSLQEREDTQRILVPLVFAALDSGSLTKALTASTIDIITALIDQHQLPITLLPEPSQQKLTQKYRQQLSLHYGCAIFILDNKGELSLLIDGISVAPNWVKLQRRVVSAGRKSELLLQAAKLRAEQSVLDATAGFGHDSLILASTGAQVTMLEQQPLLALLLLSEQQKMAAERNWQKLMSRLTIKNCSAEDHLRQVQAQNLRYDVIYLDPMFPDDSYENSKTGKGAKVGKHMQALHGLVQPPSSKAEVTLFDLAKNAITYPCDEQSQSQDSSEMSGRRLIIKRPVSAPYLAGQTPIESWQNDVLRFDGYFAQP